jgi:hypothetical protein
LARFLTWVLFTLLARALPTLFLLLVSPAVLTALSALLILSALAALLATLVTLLLLTRLVFVLALLTGTGSTVVLNRDS